MSEPRPSRLDPNWMFDPSGKPVPIEVAANIRYLERAAFAFTHASNSKSEPPIRAMLTAFCLHACQSLLEAIDTVATAEPKTAVKLSPSIREIGTGQESQAPPHDRAPHAQTLGGALAPACTG